MHASVAFDRAAVVAPVNRSLFGSCVEHLAALRCQAGHALLLDCRDGSIAQIPFDLSAVGLVLLNRIADQIVDDHTTLRHAFDSTRYVYRYTGIPGASGTEAQFDNEGNRIQTHGGQIQKIGKTYY